MGIPREAIGFFLLHLQVFFQTQQIGVLKSACLTALTPLVELKRDEHTDHYNQEFDCDGNPILPLQRSCETCTCPQFYSLRDCGGDCASAITGGLWPF